jgi:hypothetical protein
MGCLLALIAVLSPRFGVFLIWLARPAVFEAAFSPLFAILGIIFVPFTTLMYALLWSPAGLQGFDWVWLALALFIDIGGAAAGGGRFWRREQYSPYRDPGPGSM